MSDKITIKRGAELELDIESLAYGGMGLARKDNFVIFVKYPVEFTVCMSTFKVNII